jgi:hypothetical protein
MQVDKAYLMILVLLQIVELNAPHEPHQTAREELLWSH